VKKKRRFIAFICLLLFTGVMSGCSNRETIQPDLFQYKGSFVGDNSAISSIVNGLPHAEALNEIALQTNKTPFGITLTYGELDVENVAEVMQEIVTTNSTYLFTLIQNVDVVTIAFPDEQYTVSKKEVQGWYDEDLQNVADEQALQALIQSLMQDND
jgi:hypothetical protein